jgi:hypothetical protein
MITYLSALCGQLSLVSQELFGIGPLAQGREDAHDVHLEYLLIAIVGNHIGSSRRSTGQPLFDDATTSSRTAYLCTGESKRDKNLRGKKCGVRSGAIGGREEPEGSRVEGSEESSG